MEGISTRQIVLSALLPGPGEATDRPWRTVQQVTAAASGAGTRLSEQVEITAAIEELIDDGYVRRESASGDVSLRLTEAGHSWATEAHDVIAGTDIELVEGGERTECSVATAAERLGSSPVEIVTVASADGVYYADPTPEEDFVGRTDHRETFDAVVQRALRNGTGGAVLVTGPGGIGKTRLADVFLEDCPPGVDTVRTRCRGSGSEPYGPVRDLLDRIGAEDPFERAGIDAEDEDTYRSQRSALFYDLTQQFVPEDGVRVLFFDDADLADPATWSYLSALADRLADEPLVLLLAHRPGTLPEDESVSGAAVTTRLTLEGLDSDDTARLIEGIVGRRGVPPAFVDAVHERTDGIPLFVEATIETLLEEGGLGPEFGWYPEAADEIDLPAAVDETVARQLDLLDERARPVLEWIALAGGSVPASVLRTAIPFESDRVASIVGTLIEAGTLVRDGEYVDFQNNVVRDAVLAGLDAETQRRRHGALARRLAEASTNTDGDVFEDDGSSGAVHDRDGAREASSGDDDGTSATVDDRAATAAYHFEAAGDAEAAIEWYGKAARRATAVYAHETAIEHYHSLLDLARARERSGRLLDAGHQLAEVYLTVGEYDEAERYVQFVRERTDDEDIARRRRSARLAASIAAAQGDYAGAIEAATAGLDLADQPDREYCRLLATKAEAERNSSDYEAVRETSERLRDLATELGATELAAEAIQQLGVIALERSEYDRAGDCLETALLRCQAAGDRHREGDVRMALGIVAKRTGEYDEAHEHWRAALEAYEEVGDRHQIAKAYNNLGLVAKDDDRYEQAREHYLAALDAVERIGDRDTAALVRVNLGNVAKLRSEYDDAQQYLEAAIATFDAVGHDHHAAIARLNLGGLLIVRGEYETAEETLRAGIESVRSVGDTHREGQFLTALGKLACKRGHYDLADDHYADALDAAAAVENDRLLGIAHLGQARVDLRRDGLDAALENCSTAVEELRTAGERIDVARALRTLGAIETRRGEYDRAEAVLDDALGIYEVIGNERGVALVHHARGEIERHRGEHDRARTCYENALATVESLGTTHDLARIRLSMGRLAAGTGRPELACSRWEAAFDGFRSVGARREALDTVEALVDLCERERWADPDGTWIDEALALLEEGDDRPVSCSVRDWLQCHA